MNHEEIDRKVRMPPETQPIFLTPFSILTQLRWIYVWPSLRVTLQVLPKNTGFETSRDIYTSIFLHQASNPGSTYMEFGFRNLHLCHLVDLK